MKKKKKLRMKNDLMTKEEWSEDEEQRKNQERWSSDWTIEHWVGDWTIWYLDLHEEEHWVWLRRTRRWRDETRVLKTQVPRGFSFHISYHHVQIKT